MYRGLLYCILVKHTLNLIIKETNCYNGMTSIPDSKKYRWKYYSEK